MQLATERMDVAKAFVIMPFAAEFDDVYDLIKQAISEVDDGLKVVRLDEVRAAGRISEDLVHELSTSTLCVADVTGGNANVMWEVGFATALKKPLIVLNQEYEDLPFDIADLRAVMYERGSLAKTLKVPLAAAIRETLQRYSVANTTVAKRLNVGRRSIGITGTMECPPDKARNRLARVIDPYLGRGVDWYVGSYGTVDQTAVELLSEAAEKNITVVGYSSYDISGPILSLLSEAGDIAFIDARAEQVPIVKDAPSERDVLLAARCDTVIVGWDGVSGNTRQLINWLASQGKDHLVAFVPPLYRDRSEPLRR